MRGVRSRDPVQAEGGRGQMGLKDRLGKAKLGGMEVGKLAEAYKVSQSPEVQQMKNDATGSSEYEIGLRVTPADGEAYDTTINQYLLPSAQFAAGGAVTVRVDPDNRMQALLWATR